MIQGASSAIEIDTEVTLETVRRSLLTLVPYPWHLSNIHYPEKEVMANKINSVIIYFATGNGCVQLEDYNSKKSLFIDLLPDFTSYQAAQLININLKRMGA